MIGHRGENLIFIISQPRSGSTLLQRILAGSPEVHATAEPWIALAPVYAIRSQGTTADYNAQLAASALQDFCNTIPGGQASYWHAAAGFLRELYNSSLYRSDRGDGAPRRCFLDKTPRYYSIVPELRTMFPEAKFIFLLRNPLAVFASVVESWTGDDRDKLATFRDDFYTAPLKLIEAIRDTPGASVVHYEKLVTEPEVEVKRLCEFLGIPYTAMLLDYGPRKAPEGTMGDNIGIVKHTRPSQESLEKWKVTLARFPKLSDSYLWLLNSVRCQQLGYPKETLRQQLQEALKNA